MLEFCSFETLKKLGDAEKQYLETFGEDSLDRIILGEPFPTEEEAISVIKTLMDAIKSGEPLEQVSEEVWNSMIF